MRKARKLAVSRQCEQRLVVIVAFLARIAARVHPDQRIVVSHCVYGVDLHPSSAGEPDGQYAATMRDVAQRRLRRLAADGVVDHVGTVATRCREYGVVHWLDGTIDDDVGAHAPTEGSLVGTRSDRDHMCAECAPELYRGRTRATRGAQHDEPLPCA